MNDQDIRDKDVEGARKTWDSFVKASKWIIVSISFVILLLGIILTDLF